MGTLRQHFALSRFSLTTDNALEGKGKVSTERPQYRTLVGVGTDVEELSRLRSFLRSGAGRQVRLARGASLRELSRDAGVSPTTILRWETGERTPRGQGALRYWLLLQSLMGSSGDV
jgi:DNA-binding XRE family transcriptional regulator